MAMDEAIYKKEGEYLEDTPYGNVLTGFENYVKGVTSTAVGRRKQGVSENDRVFSRSSVRLADFMVWQRDRPLLANHIASQVRVYSASGGIRGKHTS